MSQRRTTITRPGGGIPARPKNAWTPEAAAQLLAVARSYLERADRLIYSYGSKTFLSGYAIFDAAFGGRGNIDCSTFLLLALAGISYDASPYATGTTAGMKAAPLDWVQADLIDFSALPTHYVEIAERIGRPELACPKGLDLEKAAAMGISVETLADEIRKSGAARRSAAIARHYLARGACFSDPACLRPGDIIFYRSGQFFREHGNAEPEIVHVGIAAEDPALMLNSSGCLSKERAMAESRPAVALEPVFGRRTPSFFARPAYRRRDGEKGVDGRMETTAAPTVSPEGFCGRFARCLTSLIEEPEYCEVCVFFRSGDSTCRWPEPAQE